MRCLAALAGVTEPFIFIIALPDFFAVGLITLITTPDLLAEAASAIGTNKPWGKYACAARGSAKGCPPDNAACEGFFGRIKNEFFYGREWKGVSLEIFMEELDRYLRWYNQERVKESLGWMSPVQYRQSLGLVA